MHVRPLGNRKVSAIGLGEMPLSIEGRPDRTQAIDTIHASLDAGVTIIDTADAYALKDRRARPRRATGGQGAGRPMAAPPIDILVATKGGHRRPGDGSWTVHGDPSTSSRPVMCRSSRSASRRSVSTSTTDRIPRSPTPNPSGPWPTFSMRGRSRWRGSPTPPWHRSTKPRTCWADAWSASRTSSLPGSGRRRPNCSIARSSASSFIPWSPLGGIGQADRIEAGPRLRPSGRRGRDDARERHAGLDARKGLPGHPHSRK